MSKLGSILGKDLTLYLLLKSYTKRLSWCVAMFHESLVSIGKSKAVAGLKHTVSLYLWAYSIHNQRKMEGRSFLFLFYKEVFQPWPDNSPFTNYKIKLIPITFFFFFFLIWDIIWILLLNLMISWNCIHLVQSSHQFRVLQASQGCLWTNQFSKMKWLMGAWLS